MSVTALRREQVVGRILVVDDELLNRTLLAANLRQAGHQVALAENGVVALALLAADSFDLVLLDLLMPDMDGYAVLAEIKANPAWQHIPVIVISGLDDTASMVECIKLGAADYLHKPFDPILLKARLESSLANKRLRDREKTIQQQLTAQKELLQQLVTVARTVTQSPSLPITLENVIKVSVSLTKADAGSLLLATGNGRITPYILDQAGQIVARPATTIESVLDTGLASWVMTQQQPAIIKDTLQDDRWTVSHERHEQVRSVLAVPVSHQQEMLGVLTLTHPDPAFFAADTLELMQAAADQMALAVHNAQIYENQRAITRRQTTVYEVLRQVGEYFELDELAETAVSLIQTHTGWPNVLFIVPTHDERQLVVKAAVGTHTLATGTRLTIGNDPIGAAFVMAETIYEPAETAVASPTTSVDDIMPLVTQLAVPFRHGNKVLGVLSVSSPAAAFTPEDIQMAELLANAISLALHNAKLYSDMRDYLTDLSALFNVSQIAGQSIVLQDVLSQALTAALSSLGFGTGIITLVDPDNPAALELAASYNLPLGMQQSLTKSGFAGSLCEYVHKRQQSLVIMNLDEVLSPTIQQMAQSVTIYGYDAYAGTPLLHQERSLGTICLFAQAETIPGNITPALLEAIGSQVATAVANARLHETIARDHTRLQTLIDSSRDGIVLINQQRHILVINQAALHLLNLPSTPLDWVNQPLREALTLLAEQGSSNVITTALAEMKQVTADNNYTGAGEYEANGQILHWQNLPVVIAGKPLGRLLALRDVTEAKMVERLREDLTHTMVHDLRNPLTSITVSLELLDRAAINLDSKYQDLLRIARGGSQQLLELVNAILDVSQLESGQLTPTYGPVNLATLVGDIFEQQQVLASEKEIALVNDLAANLPEIEADAALLRRVLQNLVGNALKFTPQHGQVTVQAHHNEEEATIQVAVNDTGPGIPATIQTGLFQKFVTGKQAHSGNGLGLAFSRLAVEAHGGQIWVDTDRAVGASFQFTLPVQR